MWFTLVLQTLWKCNTTPAAASLAEHPDFSLLTALAPNPHLCVPAEPLQVPESPAAPRTPRHCSGAVGPHHSFLWVQLFLPPFSKSSLNHALFLSSSKFLL